VVDGVEDPPGDERRVDGKTPPDWPEPLTLWEARRLDETRIDGVDGDALPPELERGGARERELSVLRRRVRPVRHRSGDRHDVDDVRAGNEARQKGAQRPDRSEVVRAREEVDPVEVRVEEPPAGGHARVVHEQVDPGMAREDSRGDGLDGGAVGDVALLVLVGVAGRPSREADYEPPACPELPAESGADPRRRAGDDRDPHRADYRVALVFQGKRGLVLGVANKRSIAWAIASRLAAGGAQLAFTYQAERIESNVRELAETVSSPLITSCDVRSDEDVARVFSEVGETFGGQLDLLVHSVAYAAAEDLEGRFTDTPRDRFWMALDVSAYSLVACARAAEPLMVAAGGGSILTMTYLGGERAVPHYNVMGVAKSALDSSVRYLAWDLGQKNIRVNAVSAGPVRTLAARSIANFPTMEAIVEERAPLHRHIDADDVGGAAAYLLGDDARNVTGTTLYVDSGYHAMGM
jgi:enoyl-[acyl-carrier protein] reductase I